MKKWLRSGKARELMLGVAAGGSLLLASLANFLTHNGYPFLRLEVAFVSVGLLGVSAAMAPFYVGQRQWGRSLLEGLLAAVFIDFNADSLALAFFVGLSFGLVTWWRRFSLIGPMAVLGSVVLVTTLLGLGGAPNWIKVEKGIERNGAAVAAMEKPAIVHIIFDEHIGLDGLQGEGVEGQLLREELRSFYLASGFAVYGGAHSQHYETVNAIPEVLNYGARLNCEINKSGMKTGRTKHLQSLVDQGYKLTIFQTDYVDYCADASFSVCITYDSSSLHPTLTVPMGAADRAGLISGKFLELSKIFGATAVAWNTGAVLVRAARLPIPLLIWISDDRVRLAALNSMNELAKRLKSVRPGDAIFAHLLLPHFPQVVLRDCSYLPWEDWEGRYFGSTIKSRRRAYYEQVRCTTRELAILLRNLSQSPAGKNAVVIVHGDHGSRIVQVSPYAYNFGKISDADMIAGFSTLFAIRAPGVQPGYIQERQPISTLLRDFATSGFRSAPHPKPPPVPTVYLADKDWKPVRRVPLPASWQDPSPQH